jgi:hypothetical protein
MKILLVVLLSSLFVGCASVPMGSLEDDKMAKEFTAPQGKSRIYLYRNEALGAAIKIPVTLNGQMKGQTAADVYFVWDVEPGVHQINCLAESNGALSVTTKANQSYFVWQEVKMGLMSAGCALHEVQADRGKAAISKCKLAASH